jgi:hypothetical protein
LAALREQVLPHSQAQFALMAEGPTGAGRVDEVA